MNQEKKDGPENPIGLYKDPQSGQYIGVINEIQADAVVQQGYRLVKEGHEAAVLTQAEIDKLDKPEADTKTSTKEK